MNIPDRYIYDCEVFAQDWFFVFKRKHTSDYFVFHNDYSGIKWFMEDYGLLAGFNCKAYDQFILRGVLAGFNHSEVKGLNDYLISGGSGYDIDWSHFNTRYIRQYDLFDDFYDGLSLKAFEAHYGMDIRETEVSFDLDRALTEEEAKLVIKYCKHDVDATDILDTLREDYLKTKIILGEKRNLSPEQSLSMTNAKLTAVFLQADKSKVPYEDERNYHYPDKLLKQYIPKDILDFFDQIHDKRISREDLFHRSIEFRIGECICKAGWGGMHGAIPNYVERSTKTRHIRNKDVASYYPHLMTLPLDYGKQYGYTSRAIPNPEVYKKVLEDRLKAKAAGNKVIANAYKLPLNTAYGCMGAGGVNDKGEYYARNAMYDPLMARSVCISGQLFILEIVYHLLEECPTMRVIQVNTDGIMVSFEDSDEATWQAITQEWQDRTGFELEEDFLRSISQRDVNNYVEVADDGSIKAKGGELVRGISTAGAFKINNNAVVVANALIEHFANGADIEQFILAENDISQFQLIARSGGMYSKTFHDVSGSMIEVQRVNRVYASTDYRYGKLYKQKGDRLSLIPSMPPHCVVDNANELTIDAVDKAWYVRLAKDKARAFLGTPKPKRNTRQINIIKKQLLERMSQIGN